MLPSRPVERASRLVVVALASLVLAACGNDAGERSDTAAAGTTTETMAATTNAREGTPARSPTEVVDAFRDAYLERDERAACALTVKSFRPPGGWREDGSCLGRAGDKRDPLSVPLEIVSKRIEERTARVFLVNSRRTRYVFRLHAERHRWKIVSFARHDA